MQYKDYYKTLGVDKKATEKEIQKAYKNLAKKYHPDINKAKDSEAKFKEINEAYEVVGDKEKRNRYDTLGANWDQNAGNYSYQDMGDIGGNKFYGSDFSDFFEVFFGQKSNAGSANPFGNMFSGMGGAQQQQQQKQQRRKPAEPHRHQEHTETHHTPREVEVEVSLNEIFEGGKRQVTIGDKKLEVSIPKGIENGKKIRVKDGNNSDIHLKIKIKEHDLFKLEGKNIVYEAPITDYDVIFGKEVNVPTLSGGSVNLKIPAGTQGGKRLRLKNLGLPTMKTEEKGDMYVKVKIMIPQNLTDKEKSLYEELKALRAGKDNLS